MEPCDAIPLTVALLEGASDVAAVRVLTEARGLVEGRDGFRLVDMEGVTNIRRHLATLTNGGRGHRVIGMCDVGEVRFVATALEAARPEMGAAGDLAAHGFYVCDRDLEDELIRGVGTSTTVRLLEDLGLGGRFATFQRQPGWSDRPMHEQLRRFCGTASGRKSLLAGALAAALTPGRVPRPLAGPVAEIENAHE